MNHSTPLSRFFTYGEAIRSDAADRLHLDNTPGPRELANLEVLCGEVMDRVRVKFGRPIRPTSMYRAPGVNQAVGGSATSQHMSGQACDFEIAGMDNLAIARAIAADESIPFDQLILEFYVPGVPSSGWVHISHDPDKPRQRRDVRTAYKGRPKTVPGLPDGGTV